MSIFTVFTIAIAGGFVACTHPLEVVGEGDIVSASGTRDCTMEQRTCDVVVTNAYSEVYTATPRTGFVFDRWDGCDPSSTADIQVTPSGNKCTIRVSQAFIEAAAGKTAPPLVAYFEPMVTTYKHTYYVSPSGSDSNAGTRDKPWKTISKANAVLVAGDIVYLRGGEYADKIAPARSGTAAEPITYKAYQGEVPLITNPPATDGKKTAILFTGRSYIVVDQIHADGKGVGEVGENAANLDFWVRFNGNASYNVIKNCTFYRSALYGVELPSGSHHNQIVNSVLDTSGSWDYDGKEVIQILSGSTNNLVEGNYIARGGHGVFFIAGKNNVIRRNVLDASWGPDKGNYSSMLIDKGGPSGYNLYELNVLKNNAPASDITLGQPSAKVEGTGQIVRRNFLYDNHNVGIETDAGYGNNLTATKNRIFGNVFFNHGGTPWQVSAGAGPDNVFKNNLVYLHRNIAIPCSYDASRCGTYDLDVKINQYAEAPRVIANSFYKFGAQDAAGSSKSVLTMQSKNPRVFSLNIVQKPTFVVADPVDPEDFRLAAGSPQIDKGDFLTRTAAAGSGKTMKVLDAGYFCDGFDMVPGDVIQMQGTNSKATVTDVDYATHTLTLDTSLTWNADQGVALEFRGRAPDIGAFD